MGTGQTLLLWWWYRGVGHAWPSSSRRRRHPPHLTPHRSARLSLRTSTCTSASVSAVMASLRSNNRDDHSTSLLDDHHDPYTTNDRNRQSIAPDASLSQPHTSSSTYSLSDAQSVSSPASSLSSRLIRRSRIVWWHFILLIGVFTYAITERYAITGTMPPLLPAASIQSLNNRTHPLFPGHSIASNATHRSRVVYMIIDGMRSDAVTSSPALSSFLTSLQPHVAVRSSLSQVPSMSHPNWLTLGTGVSTSLHGQVGNDDVVEVGWSSVWLEALKANAPNGVAGAYTWLRLFWSHLTPFTGDGTVTGFGIPDPVYTRGGSEAAVDAAYNSNFHRAIQSRSWRYDMQALFDYEMFVAYYSDVDGESHAFGPHSPQTQRAIADKTAYIQEAIAAIEAVDRINAANGVHFRTTYVITADHGHIDVGGHGGDAQVIRSIPLIFYANHSYLSAGSPTSNSTAGYSSPLPPPPASYSPSNVDIATTVAALAGVRVPRESEGLFVSDVLGVLIGAGERAYLHYADLFVQKRALARELLSVLGQSTASELLDESGDATLLPQPASGLDYSALIARLNERTGEVVQLIERAKTSHLSSQLAVSWVLSTLLLLLVLLPLLVWLYNSSTFVSIGAVVPQRVAAFFSYLSYLVHYAFARCHRAVGGRTLLPVRQWMDHSATSQRLNRTTCALGLAIVVLWLLLTIFQFNVVFRYGYRPTPHWQWQLQLWNSEYDAYVMSLGYCMGASLVICAIMHVSAVLLLRSQRVQGRLLQWLQLDKPAGVDDSAPAGFNGSAPSMASDGAAAQRVVAVYYVVLYTSLWLSVLSLLLLYSQSYHCFYFPFLWPLSSVITPGMWANRFQSFSVACFLVAACLYVGCVVWWQQSRLWSGMSAVTVVERGAEQWWHEKQRVLQALNGLDEKAQN